MAAMSSMDFEAQMNILQGNITAMQKEMHETEENMARIWRITASIFVFFMQLGFSLLEAGTVRFKNTRNIMIKNVLDTCVCAIAFWMFGYAIGFGDGSQFLGWQYPKRDENMVGSSQIAFAGNMDGVDGVQFFFQFTFAATSTTIIAGAVAERTHLWAYLFYNFFLSSLIYPVIAHIVWSEHGFLSASRHAIILGTDGVLDNAGSMVVHVTGGVTSLVGAWMVGPRIGRYDIEGNQVPFKGHSMVYMAAGTLILWVGFFAFNGGSIDFSTQTPSVWAYSVAHVCVNTTISAAFSGFTTFALTYRTKEPSPEDTFNAVIGGLVAACATSSIVRPYASAIIGVGAGLSYQAGVWVLAKLKIDDVVQAVPTHLFCGSWGAIAVGFFATNQGIRNTYGIEPRAEGLFYGKSWNLLGVQILGLFLVYAWVGLTSFTLFYILHSFGVLRVKRQEEEVGLDVAFHGGEQTTQADASEGSPVHRFVHLSRKRISTSLPKWFRNMVFSRKRKTGNTKGDSYSRGGRREVWYKSLESTAFGHFSLAMYEANYVMEDTGEVEASSSGVYIGVHDGHGGVEVAEFLKDNLYKNLIGQFILRGGGVSAEALRMAFAETDNGFKELASEAFDSSPHLATVGACSVTCVVTANAIWVANVGDCRAVLGQVRRSESGERECRALQLSVDHNLKVPAIREEFEIEHEDMPDAVVEKKGSYRVKGKVTVTKAFGDLYLKSKDFNREPLFARFRVPEPFNPPLLTAEPTVAVRLISPHDAFAIVASDGLFEYISNQEAVDIVASSPKKDVARKLIRAAIQRAAERHEIPYQDLLRMSSGQRRDYHDDMTVVVFFFDHNVQNKYHRNNKWDLEASSQGHPNARAVLAKRVQSMEDVELISTHHGGISAKTLLMGNALTEDTIMDVKES